MWGDVLKNRRAQRLGVYSGFMNKSDKHVVWKHSTMKSRKTENEQITIDKMTFKKPVSPSGTLITMVCEKAEHEQVAPTFVLFWFWGATWSNIDAIVASTGF